MNLLVIDDDINILDTIYDNLNSEFETISLAKDVNEAKEFILHDDFDCIILDIKLGDHNGGEVIKFIRENQEAHNKGVPVVVTSIIINEEFQERNKEKIKFILPKPFTMDELKSTVERAVAS